MRVIPIRRPLWGRRVQPLPALCWTAAAVAAAVTVVLVVTVFARVASGRAPGDLLAFYTAGDMIRTGDGAHLYDRDAVVARQVSILPDDDHERMGWVMPAYMAYFFAPLSLLPFNVAYLAWSAADAVLLVALLAIVTGTARPAPAGVRRAFFALALASIPSVAVVTFGQVDSLVLAAMLGCWLLLPKRPGLAGMVLALGAVKPHLLLAALLMLSLWHQWRALAGFTALAMPLALLPAVALGPGILADNLRLISSYPGMSGELSVNPDFMANWRGVAVSLTGRNDYWLWVPPLALIALAGLAAALRAWRVPAAARDHSRYDQAWALAMTLPLLYSPHLHTQTLVLLFPALALLLRHRALAGDALDVWSRVVLPAGFALLLGLWLVTTLGTALLALPVMGVYWVLARRWPEAPAAEAAGRQPELLAA